MSKNVITGSRPDVVGCFHAGGTTHFHPARFDELERQSIGIARILRTFNFKPESTILVVSIVPEVVQFAPFEKAVQHLGMYGINAESTNYDAGRIESIARQFNTPGICGIGAASLEGLKMFGHDPAQVFAGRTIWARPDAYDAVKAMDGVDARRIVILGPAVAYECAHGGLHYDSRDWSLSESEGTLHLSSRMPRITPILDLDTSVAGKVLDTACTCGARENLISVG
jgi:hypothetical protein